MPAGNVIGCWSWQMPDGSERVRNHQTVLSANRSNSDILVIEDSIASCDVAVQMTQRAKRENAWRQAIPRGLNSVQCRGMARASETAVIGVSKLNLVRGEKERYDVS